MSILSHILEHKIISIVRGTELQHMLPVAQALYAGGIRLIEVTMNTPDALEAIRLLRAEFEDSMAIGAGTVLDPESARAALLAGASFLLSPSLNVETIRLTKRYGAVSIPGAYTPTEIVTAYEHGADIVKIFPADAISPSFIKSLRGPLPQIPLMPTGGIDLHNIRAYADAGAAAFGIGGSLVPAKWAIDYDSLEQLTDKAAQFVRAAHREEI
ncbi:bifunctional 4-hydroxy-2-oxoglutarate aldolase/2-dehydro-3-deoxy-phosphogluconate aldolase [Paenibacillus planticolens]|uniref:Bifunctional 4-hydroxy-2-oxoglutarate aldolase/2-dehydro-3-deoxy-phosphogluconate aldolase n=1 Tax=Paenibacillus planticolens TaxID=2654976 RepID=A0ABX1ZM01_9BACL|nr:bifunctional 4-hydroxy-2-oxoglutarate aldolase/2-dehydro-3-deoxy-phosphogluconate aldolase [Paenibacillus planticolens]NOV01109.1 bifunctional 4-hydroxy-2-oxoglutarate aldolase/2-dehydro-3-deoxy-phosphogluconate aldolase [Paenibacillus planticolens]